MPILSTMDRPKLRDLHHPDLSELLVHFTGRPRPRENLPQDIKSQTPQERLESILQSQVILAMRTYFTPIPVVCFTESTWKGVEYMIGGAGFEPWGIVFHREVVFDQGGGPVFHLRGDEWEYRRLLPDRIKSRVIKFAPGEAEWVEEREWRIPYDDGNEGFKFEPGEVEALIVGDPNWPPVVEIPDYVWTPEGWEGGFVTSRPAWLPTAKDGGGTPLKAS